MHFSFSYLYMYMFVCVAAQATALLAYMHAVMKVFYIITLVLYFWSNKQCWEGYFGNVMGYRLQVTLRKM